MIEKLSIKNYLIIKNAEIEFDKGLNILTGETGAGKTIILDALAMILGERADYSLIRKDEDKLIIEGFFEMKNNNEVRSFLEGKDIDDNEGCVIIRREILSKGISRNFVNDSPVGISDLKQLGDMIVDIHSQNEHQSLLKKETHLKLLDSYSDIEEDFKIYKNEFDVLKKMVKELEILLNMKDEIFEKKKYIEFQLKEINNINPAQGEYEELEQRLNKMENSEEISLGISNSINLLYEDEKNIAANLSLVIKELEKVEEFDDEVKHALEELRESYINIKDSVERLQGVVSSLEFDPLEIEKIRDRLGSLNFLKKRFNKNIDEVIKYAGELTKEFDLLDNYDSEIERKKNEIGKTKTKLYELAKKLSDIRKKNAVVFEKNVNKLLKEVGLETAEFKTDFCDQEYSGTEYFAIAKNGKRIILTERGIDEVEFLIRTNKGSELTPLRKSVSGGEVSRIMLAIKATLAGRDEIPILVFDEIDTGISGRIADKVGKVMKNLAAKRQIISITHLPQIAALSSKHFCVNKTDLKTETITEIVELNGSNRIEEIAKMLSGEKVSEASRESAKQLLGV